MAKATVSKLTHASEAKPQPSEADQKASLPGSIQGNPAHIEMIGGHISNLSWLLHDAQDGGGSIGDRGDVEQGVSVLLDGLSIELSKVTAHLMNLGKIATARGYK